MINNDQFIFINISGADPRGKIPSPPRGHGDLPGHRRRAQRLRHQAGDALCGKADPKMLEIDGPLKASTMVIFKTCEHFAAVHHPKTVKIFVDVAIRNGET